MKRKKSPMFYDLPSKAWRSGTTFLDLWYGLCVIGHLGSGVRSSYECSEYRQQSLVIESVRYYLWAVWEALGLLIVLGPIIGSKNLLDEHA